MSEPDRIWTAPTDGKCHVGFETPSLNYTQEYVRRDSAVLAALPEVQALIAEAVAKERSACASLMGQSHIEHMLRKGRDPARYSSAWSVAAAAIRNRGEGKG